MSRHTLGNTPLCTMSVQYCDGHANHSHLYLLMLLLMVRRSTMLTTSSQRERLLQAETQMDYNGYVTINNHDSQKHMSKARQGCLVLLTICGLHRQSMRSHRWVKDMAQKHVASCQTCVRHDILKHCELLRVNIYGADI